MCYTRNSRKLRGYLKTNKSVRSSVPQTKKPLPQPDSPSSIWASGVNSLLPSDQGPSQFPFFPFPQGLLKRSVHLRSALSSDVLPELQKPLASRKFSCFHNYICVSFLDAIPVAIASVQMSSRAAKQKLRVDFHDFIFPEVVDIKNIRGQQLGRHSSSEIFDALATKSSANRSHAGPLNAGGCVP